jgi:hypothetical protein
MADHTSLPLPVPKETDEVLSGPPSISPQCRRFLVRSTRDLREAKTLQVAFKRNMSVAGKGTHDGEQHACFVLRFPIFDSGIHLT